MTNTLAPQLFTPFTPSDMLGEAKRGAAKLHAQQELTRCVPGSARAELYQLQAETAAQPELDFPLQHVFAPGVYARTIQLPANSLILGKIHKHSHVNILSQGCVTVFTEAGGLQTLQGPLTMVSSPGTKRAVFAHTDAVWTTIHPTQETDLAMIEEEVIAKSYSDYESFLVNCGPSHTVLCQSDFQRVLLETEKSAEWVQAQSENPLDQVDFPDGYDHLYLGLSPLAGTGLFSCLPIVMGSVIGPARLAGKRTPLGRYCNHSPWPNAAFLLLPNGDLQSVAIAPIAEGDEIVNDYRQGALLWGATLNPSEALETARQQSIITGEGFSFAAYGQRLIQKERSMRDDQNFKSIQAQVAA